MGTMAEQQMKHSRVDLPANQQGRILELVASTTAVYDFDNSPGCKSWSSETYDDIRHSPMLHDEFRKLCGYPARAADPQELVGEPNALRALTVRPFKDPVDLLLWTADLNLQVRMSTLVGGTDLHTSPNALIALKDKLLRTATTEARTKGFGRLLDLHRLPDLPALVAKGALSFQTILEIRNQPAGKKFRAWLAKAEPKDARDLERLYVESITRVTSVASIPAKLVRFALTSAWSIAEPVSGTMADAADNFFAEKWLGGFAQGVLQSSERLCPRRDMSGHITDKRQFGACGRRPQRVRTRVTPRKRP